MKILQSGTFSCIVILNIVKRVLRVYCTTMDYNGLLTLAVSSVLSSFPALFSLLSSSFPFSSFFKELSLLYSKQVKFISFHFLTYKNISLANRVYLIFCSQKNQRKSIKSLKRIYYQLRIPFLIQFIFSVIDLVSFGWFRFMHELLNIPFSLSHILFFFNSCLYCIQFSIKF